MKKHILLVDKIKLRDKKICIIGTGGFGRETLCCLIDVLQGTGINVADVACIMVTDNNEHTGKIMGVDIISFDEFNPKFYDVVVAIGVSATRKKVVESLPVDTTYATIIHPSAIISDWVTIGEGSIVTAGVIITCNVIIGKHAQLNLGTTIGHDCNAGDYFTTSPATNISGDCKFGDNVFIGTNGSIKQGVKICDNVTIGMGGVVTKHIIEPGTYVGLPAKKCN